MAPLLDDPLPGRLNVGLDKFSDLIITVLVKVVFMVFVLCEYFVKVEFGKMFENIHPILLWLLKEYHPSVKFDWIRSDFG